MNWLVAPIPNRGILNTTSLPNPLCGWGAIVIGCMTCDVLFKCDLCPFVYIYEQPQLPVD